MAELLSAYTDTILRKGGIKLPEEELDSVLEKIV